MQQQAISKVCKLLLFQVVFLCADLPPTVPDDLLRFTLDFRLTSTSNPRFDQRTHVKARCTRAQVCSERLQQAQSVTFQTLCFVTQCDFMCTHPG